jgi:hypothetical protein
MAVCATFLVLRTEYPFSTIHTLSFCHFEGLCLFCSRIITTLYVCISCAAFSQLPRVQSYMHLFVLELRILVHSTSELHRKVLFARWTSLPREHNVIGPLR